MQISFYKNIKSNFITNSVCITSLLLCVNGIFALVPKQSNKSRDFAFDVSVAINEYKRYYWQYPDSMESFLSFAKDYATHFWNDLSRKEKSNSTWYQTYKKLERNKQDYSIVESGGTCTFTNQKRQEEIVFTNTACEDCKLESLNISDFRRLYVLSAFDSLNHILWNQSDSLYLLYAQLQKLISLAENTTGTSEVTNREMLLFQYRHSDATLSFRCMSETEDYPLSATQIDFIRAQFKEYCDRNEEISYLNMYMLAAPLQRNSSRIGGSN